MNLKLKIKIIENFDSQTEFAKATGIPENLVSRFIRRHREPSAQQKKIMAEALNDTEDILFAPVPDNFIHSGGEYARFRTRS